MSELGMGVVCLKPNPMASERLICVPYAGAGPSAFNPWVRFVPDHVELFALHLPGRETRAREPFLADWEPMVEAAVSACLQLPSSPVRVFGHSLGALIGLDLAAGLVRKGVRVEKLVVAGRPWPGVPLVEHQTASIRDLSDAAFLEVMKKRYGPLHPTLADPDIAAMVLPILRADLGLLASFRYTSPGSHGFDLDAVFGRDDPITAGTEVDAWATETGGVFRSHAFDSGHYFVDTHAQDLVDVIYQ